MKYKLTKAVFGKTYNDIRKGPVSCVDTWKTELGEWPACYRAVTGGGVGPILCDDLVNAVENESIQFICATWRVNRKTAYRWRRALEVGRINKGTQALLSETRLAMPAKLRKAIAMKGGKRRQKCSNA